MQVPRLHSITNLRPEDVIQTNGSTPVRVLCDNLEYYVVKYPKRKQDFDLTKEFLGASFLSQWGLAIPEFAFVNVRQENVPMGLHPRIQPYFFQGTCFGLKYERHFDEVTKLMEGMSDYQKNLIVRKEEFLEIALYDLWLANEDRNENNYNLLYDISDGYRFVPIDHQATFNNGIPGEKLSLLTENESLIGTPMFRKLFSRKEVSQLGSSAAVKNKFYFCVRKCFENLETIVAEMPEDWQIESEVLVENLRQTIFHESWLKEVWNTFLEYLQIATNPS
ncbi:MAG: hypothetical protein HY842_13640 [Bacteroidetes bacterium]|nr:hypothetical protein [Bacteroidota bacterium]